MEGLALWRSSEEKDERRSIRETPPWPQETKWNGRAASKSPTLWTVCLPSPHRLLPPNSPTGHGEVPPPGKCRCRVASAHQAT